MKFLRSKILDIEPVVKAKAANFIEIPDQYLDAGKILKLGFKPQISFEEGLDRSVAWYKNNFNHLERLAQHHIIH